MNLRMCFNQTSVINLALLSTQHSPQVTIPTPTLPRRNPNSVSIAVGEDEEPMTDENSQLGQAQSSPVLRKARRDSGAVQRADIDEEYMDKFQDHRKFLLTILQTSLILSGNVGRIKVTPCTNNKNNSGLLTNTNGQLSSRKSSCCSHEAHSSAQNFELPQTDLDAVRQSLFKKGVRKWCGEKKK